MQRVRSALAQSTSASAAALLLTQLPANALGKSAEGPSASDPDGGSGSWPWQLWPIGSELANGRYFSNSLSNR